RLWTLAAIGSPVGVGTVALAGGQLGREMALGVIGGVAMLAIGVAQRRRGGRIAYTIPPAQVLAVGIVAFVAAQAVLVNGGATSGSHTSGGDWAAVAAAIAALVG